MKYIVLIFMLSCSLFVNAQKGGSNDEKWKEFEAQKIAFFTHELDLSTVEAEKFWPIYNEMQKKSRELMKSCDFKRPMPKNAKPGSKPELPKMTDEECRTAIHSKLKMEMDLQKIKSEYYEKMMQAISPMKVLNLDMAEEKFRRALFNKLRQGGGPQKDHQ